MKGWMYPLVLLSPGKGGAAALRKQALAGKWVDHSVRDKTLTLQTPRGRLKLAYDRALVCGVPIERLWAKESIDLALSTFGGPVRVRRWVERGDVVVEIVQGGTPCH
jgi:hypothetical protein